eukprot:364493-Chlamydomonas_euryale.AAC.5
MPSALLLRQHEHALQPQPRSWQQQQQQQQQKQMQQQRQQQQQDNHQPKQGKQQQQQQKQHQQEQAQQAADGHAGAPPVAACSLNSRGLAGSGEPVWALRSGNGSVSLAAVAVPGYALQALQDAGHIGEPLYRFWQLRGGWWAVHVVESALLWRLLHPVHAVFSTNNLHQDGNQAHYCPDTYCFDNYCPDAYCPNTYCPDTFCFDTYCPTTYRPDTYCPSRCGGSEVGGPRSAAVS